MLEIAFYHLFATPLEKVLPVLLQKTLDIGKRAVVIVGTTERIESISSILWTSDPGSWLPHGSRNDGNPEHQPIWLTTELENPNKASYLFLIDGTSVESYQDFERCFDLFDGNEISSVQAARDRWVKLNNQFNDCNYWQQDGQGKWEKKATA